MGVPYCATFTIFSDYMRNSIRLAALAQCGTIFVTTHDSIAVGEDGPTHQPIETIPSLRLIPDLTVIRPADCNETAGAYKIAVEKSKLDSMPTFLALTRQALPNLPNSCIDNVVKGAPGFLITWRHVAGHLHLYISPPILLTATWLGAAKEK